MQTEKDESTDGKQNWGLGLLAIAAALGFPYIFFLISIAVGMSD
ncbi:MAG TPA: hypothetical protein V6C86_21055 [Oculatellaceae cyanobacterium]